MRHADAPIAVTGAGGFLGRAVVTHLRVAGEPARLHAGPEGAPGPAEAARFDIRDATALRVFLDGARCVVHLAGPPDARAAARDPLSTLDVHVGGVAVLMAVAAAAGCAVVLVSSGLAAGGLAWPSAGVYPDAKAAAEAVARAYASQVPVVILRPANVYGAGAHPTTLVPELIALARSGRPVEARAPEATVDLVHVEDVAAAVGAAIDAVGRCPSGSIFPIDTLERPTAGAVASFIRACASGTFGVDAADGLAAKVEGRPGAALPGWRPRIPWRSGISELFRTGGP